MAKNEEKVPVIDHNGKQFPARRSWVDKHAEAGNGFWRGGMFQFYTEVEMEARRAHRSGPPTRDMRRLHRARLHVSLRANEPTPATGGAPFLAYPFPEQRARGGSLRERYPDLAKVGAGMR